MPLPRGLGFGASARVLLGEKAVEARNLLRFGGSRTILWTVFLLVLGTAFFLFDWWFFHRLLSGITRQVEFLAPVLLNRLVHSLFLACFGMLGLSVLSSSINGFYLSREIPFLLTTPLSPTAFIFQRFLLVFLQSSWMILIFAVPPFLAYRQELALPVSFIAWFMPVFLLLLLIPALLGGAVGMVLMRFLPAARVQHVLTFLSLVFITGVIFLFRMSRPERLFMDVPAEQILDFVETFAIPQNSFLPTTWATLAVEGLAQGKGYAGNLALLAGGVVGAGALFYASFRAFYRRGLDTLDQGESVRERKATRIERWFGRVGGVTGAYLVKDLLLFIRDPGRWTQVFLLGALVVLYVYNAKYFPLGGTFYRNLVAFLNLGMTGFVLSALCVRFVFPAVSLEGRSIWVTLSAPVPAGRVFLAKYLFAVVPLTVVSLVLTLVTNLMMGVHPAMMALFACVAAVMALALAGLNLGLGAIYPRFRYENEAQVSVSPGGVMAMILSLFYVVGMVVALAGPVWHMFSSQLKARAMLRPDSLVGLGAALLLSLLFAVVPVKVGLSRVRKWQEGG